MANPKIKKKELSQDFRDEFVKSLQGKEFILYGGLLTLGKSEGIKSIKTEMLQAPSDDNGGTCIVKAVVIDKDGNEWHGLGDADSKNTNSKVAAHKIRMAETRAKGRALRDCLGIDMVMDSELTDPYEKEMITQQQAKTIKKLMEAKGIDKNEMSKITFDEFGVKTATRLEKEQAASLIALLEIYEEEEEDEEELEDDELEDDEDEDDDEEDDEDDDEE
jgi:hypothetical protein